MKVKIVLALATTSNSEIVLNAKHYVSKMTNNPFFAGEDVTKQLEAVFVATDSLQSAIELPWSESKSDQIRIARDSLERQLTILASKVEALANNPRTPDEQRQVIVHSAGMNLKGSNSAKKRVFVVENTKIEGTVSLMASGGASGHEWQYTKELSGYTERLHAPGTTTASTEISGLIRGTKYAFFHKPIVAGQTTEWEGPLFLIVS